MVRVHLVGAGVRTIEVSPESMVDEVMDQRGDARYVVFEVDGRCEVRDLRLAHRTLNWWSLPPCDIGGDDVDVVVMRCMLRG